MSAPCSRPCASTCGRKPTWTWTAWSPPCRINPTTTWECGPDIGPDDFESVLAYYQELVAVKRHILEFDIERIVVDHDTVVTEVARALNLGVARARGWLVDDDDATYHPTGRHLLALRCRGEDDGRGRRMSKDDAKPIRTLLFVAGSEHEDVLRPGHGADAIVIDLEEPRTPFPESERVNARGTVRSFSTAGGAAGGPALFARVQPPDTGQTLKDLRAVMGRG